jgi:hypothetical protein
MLSAMATPHADDRDQEQEQEQELAQAAAVSAALLAAINAVRRSATTDRVRNFDATRPWVVGT